MGLFYIVLSIVSSLTIAHFLKLSKKAEARLINVLTVNYLVASIISASISGNEFIQNQSITTGLVLFAFSLGVLFIVNLFIYSASLNRIGMGISIAAMRMSLVIPIGLSLFVYGESIQVVKYAGVALVFVALYLMLPKVDSSKMHSLKNSVFPVLLFVFTGLADASLKIFEKEFSSSIPEYGFLSLIFSSSFLLGSLYLFIKKEFNFSKKEVLYGIIIGVANLYSSFFLLLALKEMNGSIVFSLTNISNVVLGALIGFIVWKDTLSNTQKTGICLAIIAILLIL